MEVLSGTEISREVLLLIEGAREYLVLVSPYFDPWDRLATEIKRAKTRPGLKVRLLLRGGEDRDKQEAKARDLQAYGVDVAYLNRLHAKVYISDSQAIVTSMNLLKSSAIDSWEIALRADRVRDATTYSDILKHTGALLQRAKDETLIAVQPQLASGIEAFASMLVSSPPAWPTAPAEAAAARPVAAPRARSAAGTPAPKRGPAAATKQKITVGHCIRCAATIGFDAGHPYCAACLKSWSRYKNPDYEEKHCHGCGKPKVTTMAKPLCKPCWDATK